MAHFSSCCYWLGLLLLATSATAAPIQLKASFSQHGIRGDVLFTYYEETPGLVRIQVDLISLIAAEEATYDWALHELPVEHVRPAACSPFDVGERVIDLTDQLGPVTLPVNRTLDLKSEQIGLTGPESLWGRTLVFDGPRSLCATVMPFEGLKVAQAKLRSPVAGSVSVLSWSARDSVDVRVLTDLHHISDDSQADSNHAWKLYITDVLDSKADRDRGNCDALQVLFDPGAVSGEGCSTQEPHKCKMGDLSGRLGLVRVAARPGAGAGGGSRRAFRDASLALPDALDGRRHLYVVLFDRIHPERVLACARFRHMAPRRARAAFAQRGVRGEIVVEQRSPWDQSRLLVNLTGLNGLAGGFHVHEYPVPIPKHAEDAVCSATANHYNPWRWNAKTSPPPGRGTADLYELGDLSGKFGMLTGLASLETDVSDTTLPLFGSYAVAGRSVVIHRAADGSRWVCTNLELVGVPMITAVAVFRYPLGGRVLLRQPASDPTAETTIHFESLIYSDGSANMTSKHQLELHVAQPDQDYHDWQNRCRSVGPVFNPFKVSERSNEECGPETAVRCAVGDLTMKHDRLTVAGRASEASQTQRFFTDANLPLSGPHSVVGRSLVLLDDASPVARGNRLACTPITFYPRHKAVVRDWYGNGLLTPLSGKIEFIQETEHSASSIQAELKGLGGAIGRYGLFAAPVRADLLFPCTEQAIGELVNQLKVNTSSAALLPAGIGTPDQYAIGDLSSKFGRLEGLDELRAVFNDSNLPLYGATSIVGRSVALNRASDGERWTCGAVGWGFSPAEAVEIRAMASFHHPAGYAWGYVRMSQVVYNDGSSTETVIEINLKHPGRYNGRSSRNHRWQVFVNPVGVDAAVESPSVRCIAAGFVWNPAFVQLTDPRNEDNYKRECQPHVPYRCMVGDLSGRLGNINVGLERYVFSDRNLPLHGKLSVMGRSLVILAADGGSERFACANIQPDRDIFKFVVIRKPSQFQPSEFIDDVRRVMGLPEWMLAADARQTRDVQNGRCMQYKLHFYGPFAPRIEQLFSVLMQRGRLDETVLDVPGVNLDPRRKKTIKYRVCSDRDSDPNDDGASKAGHSKASVLLVLLLLLSVGFRA